MSHFTYFTIATEGVSDFRDRGSKFFGYAYPVSSVDEAKARLQGLKKMHPKATHLCFAWHIGAEGETVRVNDDGEPSGSAGKPIEGQILSRKLTNLMVVVVRYFGGSLLGVPGLIQAYKTAAGAALDQCGIIEKNIEYAIRIQFDYTMMNDVQMVIKQYHCRISGQDMGLYCTYDVLIPLEHKEKALQFFRELRGWRYWVMTNLFLLI
jgi:uncharacterized YigZ family protein